MKRRLDGPRKVVAFTAQQFEDMRAYCREHGIKSESELIRQAVVHYMDRDGSDGTLRLSALKDIKSGLSQALDTISVLFTYLHNMHGNLLAYLSEIPAEFKDAAYASSRQRLERFFASFQERLREDSSFFEKVLHRYVTGSLE